MIERDLMPVTESRLCTSAGAYDYSKGCTPIKNTRIHFFRKVPIIDATYINEAVE